MSYITNKAGITLDGGFKLDSAQPLDVRFVIASGENKDDLLASSCYAGMEVWDSNDNKKYRAVPKTGGGFEWKEIGTIEDIPEVDFTGYATEEWVTANHATKAEGIFYVENDGSSGSTWKGKNDRITSYYDGLVIVFKVPVSTSSSTITLNINDLGAKTLYMRGTTKVDGDYYAKDTMLILSYSSTTNSNAGGFYTVDYNSNSNTVPSAYCDTAAKTAAKTATCSNYTATANTYTHVLITTSNTAQSALTLNINTKGAKPIYINGAASSTTNYTLPAGTYIAFYDGTNYYFQTDGTIPNHYTKEQVNNLIAPAVVMKGTLGTDGTITALPAANASTLGDMYKVITAGTYASITAKVGDVFICYTTDNTNYQWALIPAGDSDTDTWREVKVNGTSFLGNGITTKPLNLKNGDNVSITTTANTGDVTVGVAIKTLKTDNTTAQTTSASETIAGSGTINLHKVSKTGTYSDLIGTPDLDKYIEGPSSSTDNAIVRYDGTDGKKVQNSTVKIDDSGNVTLPTGASLRLDTYGTRFLTLTGNSIEADMSKVTGGWAGAFASVKDPSGTTTTMLGWYGGGSGLTHIFMGGSYSDPALKMTGSGNFTIKKPLTIAETTAAPFVVSSTAVVSNLNADLLDGNHASTFATKTDLDKYLPLTGSSVNSTTNNMTGPITFWHPSTLATGKTYENILINSYNKDVNIWHVYGNSGSWASQFGFNLLYKGEGSGNENYLALYAHNQNNTTHPEVYRILQDGTTTWKTAINFTGGISENGTALSSKYQALDADLTAIAGLTGTSGFLKKTATNTWALDTGVITGSGTSGYIAKFNGANTITNGPAFGSDATKFLNNKGEWAVPTGTTAGTVTSIGMTVPTGLSVSPATITSSGTFAITYASGYAIPTTSKQSNWDTAYGWGDHAAAGYLTEHQSIKTLNTNNATAQTVSASEAIAGSGTINLHKISKTGNAGDLTAGTIPDARLPYRLKEYSGGSSVAKADDATKQGFYYVTSGDGKKPPFKQIETGTGSDTGNDYHVFTTAAYSADWVHQLGFDCRSNDLFVRRKHNKIWQPWTSIVKFQPCTGDNGNTLGTITDNAIPRWDTTRNTTLQNSGVTIDDNNNVTTPGTMEAATIKKTGGADTHVLLAGGGTKAVDDITGTTYGADRGISLSNGNFGHSNTAVTAVTTAGLYKIKYDAYGHITGTESFTLPTVNNGTLTIQKNGENVATFTANQSGNATANITVPEPADYYWADIKVSSTSSTATTPTVQKIGITGSTATDSAAAVTMEYDSSYKALKFSFA